MSESGPPIGHLGRRDWLRSPMFAQGRPIVEPLQHGQESIPAMVARFAAPGKPRGLVVLAATLAYILTVGMIVNGAIKLNGPQN